MIGLGTLINVGGVIAGGIVGLLCGKIINERLRDALIKAIAVCVMFIGIGGTLEKMLTIENGVIVSGGTIMMVVSIALGTLIGTLLHIDDLITRFGEFLKRKTNSNGDNRFVDGFVTASVTFCVGAMAVIGCINDALYGDYSVLIAKTIIDTIFVVMLTSSMGKGCIFSAISVAVVEGLLTLGATFIAPIMTDAASNNLALVGSILIFCIGLNMMWEGKIKVINMMPSIFIAVAWAFIF